MRGQARANEDARQRFSALYDRQFAFVWRALRRLGLRGAATEDAAQEVWLVVFRHLHRLDPEGSPRPWLYTIARRIAWRQRRTKTRAERKIRALKVAPAPLEAGVDARLEATTVIESYLDRLTPEQRQAFLLFELLAMTGKEVAATVGIKEATAYSRLRLAREHLGSMIAADKREHIVAVTREADRADRDQPQRTWALLVPSLGVRGPALPAAPGPSAPAALAARALAAITSSPGISGAVSAVLAGFIFVIAGTKPVDIETSALIPSSAEGADTRQEPDSALPVPELNTGGNAAGSSESSESSENSENPKKPNNPNDRDGPDKREPAPRERSAAGERSTVAGPGADKLVAPSAESPAGLSQDRLSRETALLMAARRALADNKPALALAHLDEHALHFGEGALFDVREASRVDVLCALGRNAEASKVADALARASTSAASSSAMRVASEGCRAATLQD